MPSNPLLSLPPPPAHLNSHHNNHHNNHHNHEVLPRWRQPAFIRLVHASVTRDQFARFRKIYHEPFYLLESNQAHNIHAQGGDLRFAVSGSTQSIYTVTINSEGTVRCSCKDAMMTCRRKSCCCKHACFVLYRVLHLESLTFFQRMCLSPEERASLAAASNNSSNSSNNSNNSNTTPIHRSGETLIGTQTTDQTAFQPHHYYSSSELDSICTSVSSTLRLSGAPCPCAYSFTTICRPPEPGDECPICYDTLVDAVDDSHDAVHNNNNNQDPCEEERENGKARSMVYHQLLGCPDCGKAVHKLCAERWLASVSARPSCVYCRSSVWRHYTPRQFDNSSNCGKTTSSSSSSSSSTTPIAVNSNRRR
jgi:hypothetical protein